MAIERIPVPRQRFFRPAGALDHYNPGSALPEPGDLIGWWGDRKPYRVLSVDEVHQANWSEQTHAAWLAAKWDDLETWPGRERRVHVEPARNQRPDGKDRLGLPLYPWAVGTTQWVRLEDPFPVCVDCGCLWPCPCHDQNVEAEEANVELERLAGILPGCCWGCGKPITARQHSIVFEGENLLLPGAGAPAFHSAGSVRVKAGLSCRTQAIEYEERWVAAGAGRGRRLTCEGTLWRHIDWSECTVGETCPGSSADHRSYYHCNTAVVVVRDVDGSDLPTLPPSRCAMPGCRGVAGAGPVRAPAGQES